MKILVIKLGAKGDIIRTLPILSAIKEKYPNPEIFWVTKPENVEMLQGINMKILASSQEENSGIFDSNFDILYNFDIDDEATKLASEIKANKKYGFYKKGDYAAAFNLPAEYYLNTLFDDETKRTNKKTYQEMIFNTAELPWKKQHYSLQLSEENNKFAEQFVKENNIDAEKLIGIHIGASSRWPSKIWAESKVKEFIKKSKEKGYEILLFGGPNEKQRHDKLISELREEGIIVYKNNPENSDKEFISLMNLCKAVICSDSLALHVALALKKPTIALFFCTSPHEVEDYDLLQKIISPKLYDFFPEKMDQYNEELVNSISSEEVLKALNSIK